MKIGELNERCGNCSIIGYCTEPYETPQLCACAALENIDEEEYKRIAESVTEEEINDKLKENNTSQWTHKRNGAILDIVLEKLCMEASCIL